MDSLLELYNHTMTVRVWNAIDKVSARARYDRPKAFRLPVAVNESDAITSQPSHFPGVYHGLSVTSVKQARQKSYIPTMEFSDFEGDSREQSIESLCPSQRSHQKIPPLINIAESTTSVNVSNGSKLNIPNSSSTVNQGLKGISKQRLKQLQDEAIENERIHREGLAVLSIKLADLFGEEHKVSVCVKNSSSDLKYFEVSVCLESPLMSEEQRSILNPMTIIIKDCTFPPVKEENDKLLHVSYQFLDKPNFQTHGLPYSTKLTWKSNNVILLGTIKPQILLEYLRGPAMILEILEKDEKCLNEVSSIKDALYGDLIHDSLLGICSQCMCESNQDACSTCTCTSKKSAKALLQAKLDMSCLLSGLKTMEFTLPIIRKRSHQEAEVSDNYNDSQISVIVKLTYPLSYPVISTTNDSLHKQQQLTPFGRLVYIVYCNDNSTKLVNTVLNKVNEINATGLNLTRVPLNQRQAVLSTYKLTNEQISSSKCDIITGIHINDCDQHIFMFEGLYWKGLQKIWEDLPHQSAHDQSIRCFYDSDYTFSHRLYGVFDVDIVHISLPQALQVLVPEPKLYLHDAIPKVAFHLLMNLHELKYAQDFSCIIRNDMFPSADMVNSLNIYCSQQALSEQTGLDKMQKKSSSFENHQKTLKRSRSFEPLSNRNLVYESLLVKRQELPVSDKIAQNILKIRQLSNKVKKGKKLHQRSASEGCKPVSLYSSQTYNSILMNKAALRKQLHLTRRYTYCQQYHSMTIEPVNASEELKLFWKGSNVNKWMTNEGFTCYQRKTQKQSNVHQKDIHSSRKDELHQPFTDNLLHSSPTVDWKTFTWDNRFNDFDRYKQHSLCFGTKYPVTIHLAGDSRRKEAKLFLDREAKKWKNKVVVDHLNLKLFRQGIKTELSCRAASQQDRLQGLLKDEPIIPSAIAPTNCLRVDKIPALSTVKATEMKAVSYIPGDIALSKSLKRDCNIIPIHET